MVETESLGGFCLDDNQIYYNFFDNLNILKNKAEQENKQIAGGYLIIKAIEKTINSYFGPTNANAKARRIALTQAEIVTNEDGKDEFVYPSIKKQKGQRTALCTEKAAVAHNLWLLTGRKSYFITTKDCKLEGADAQYQNDAHSFCVFFTGTRYNMFDLTMNVVGKQVDNPVDLIHTNKPLMVGKNIYTGNKS